MEYIDKTSSENTGGGCWVDFIHLKDGRVIGLNDECVVLYESMEEFWECGTKDRPSFAIPPKRMTEVEMKALADVAANEAIRHIQDKLGIASGDFAGLYFCDERWDRLLNILSGYICAEIVEGKR